MLTAVAFAALIGTLVVLIARLKIYGRWQLGAALAALTASAVLLLAGVVSVSEVVDTASRLWRSFVTLAAIMVMAGAAGKLGAFQGIGARLFAGSASAGSVFNRAFVFAAATSTVLGSDAMILLLTPTVLPWVAQRWPTNRRVLLALAFGLFMAIGVAPLVVSNPMNLLVAEYAGLSFNAYAGRMVPLAFIGWLIAWAVLRVLFRNDLQAESTGPQEAAALGAAQWTILAVLLLVVASYPLISLVQEDLVWTVAAAGAGVSLLVVWRSGLSARHVVAQGVAWDVLAFLFGVFVIGLGLQNVGVVDQLSRLYDGASLYTIGLAASIASAVLNNHPTAVITLLAIEQLPVASELEILALLVGGDLGPRLLPIGSLAGLLWLDASRRAGLQVSVWEFSRVGALITVPTLLACLWVLSFVPDADLPEASNPGADLAALQVMVSATGQAFTGVEAVCDNGFKFHDEMSSEGVAVLLEIPPDVDCKLWFKGGGPPTKSAPMRLVGDLACEVAVKSVRCAPAP